MNRWRCVFCSRYSRFSSPSEYLLLGMSLCEEHKESALAQIKWLNRCVIGVVIMVMLTLVLTLGGVL